MEKIKLNELEHSAYGIAEFGDSLKVTVAGITDYADFRSTLTKENLATIEVYSEGGVLSTVFEGYTTVTGKFDIKENEDGTMDVAVYLKKPDPVLEELAELRAEIAAIKAAQ